MCMHVCKLLQLKVLTDDMTVRTFDRVDSLFARLPSPPLPLAFHMKRVSIEFDL